MEKTLWKEFARNTLISLGIFSALFLILYIVEWAIPSLSGVLLQWYDPAFVVGIPASVIGVAYVLTIRNPKNYTGFVGGMVMAVLLAAQFFLLGSYDLMILQLAVFFPFLLISFLRWRRQTLSLSAAEHPFYPEWLSLCQRLITLFLLVAIIIADYALATLVIQHNSWSDNSILKLIGGLMIASSTLANFILIYQKIDAWIWWVVYALAGMIFYALIGNAFSFVLFAVFLLVNGAAGIAWIKAFKAHK
jgi:nicotinamide riboside transporter PnuC